MFIAQDVYKAYDNKVIFSGATFHVREGETALLLGDNGSGKTSLFRLFAGLDFPDKGHIERRCLEAELGYLGHKSFLYPQLSALENLQFWGKAYKKNIHEVALLDLLDSFSLAFAAYESVQTFSRGMLQNLSLARLVLLEPRALLLDEPSTGLDMASQKGLYALIKGFQKKGTTILWTSHQSAQDAPFANSILKLEQGQIVEKELKSEHNTPKVTKIC